MAAGDDEAAVGMGTHGRLGGEVRPHGRMGRADGHARVDGRSGRARTASATYCGDEVPFALALAHALFDGFWVAPNFQEPGAHGVAYFAVFGGRR